MRLAVIVASMLALTAPLQASNSCMSKTEARQHFGSAHIYWHGSDRCRDAAPTRQRQVRKKLPNIDRQIQRVGWRQAMSEMLPDDGTAQTNVAQAAGGTAGGAADWLDRWIDIVPVVPRPQTERPPKSATVSPAPMRESESAGMPHIVVVLAFFAFVLIFATIEILLRNDGEKR